MNAGLKTTLYLLAGFFLVMQLAPYGREHSNPPVVSEPSWPDAESRALAERACYDCHSNETEWPWYSNIAPISWLLTKHVEDGRDEVNCSVWEDCGGCTHGEFKEVLLGGEMPLPSYLILHPEARLTDAERAQLLGALESLP